MALTLPPLAQYADYLKAIYSTLPTLKKYNLCLPMPSKKSFYLVTSENQTIEESRSDDQQRIASKKKRRIDVAEIFKDGRARSKTILVEGLSGAGKSTLATHISKGWDKMDVLEEYSLVVLLRVEEIRVREAKKLADFFYHPDVSLQTTVVEQVVGSKGEGVLLIFDGIDQLSPNQLDGESLLAQILERSCLSKATLLLTGRPGVSANLLSKLGLCVEIDMLVELRGFSSEDIEQHAECVLGHNDVLIDEFTDYVSENPVIQRLMHIPLNTTTVIEVFKTAKACKKHPPKTTTQLYTELCRHLLKYYMLVKGVNNTTHMRTFPERLEELPRKVYQQMRIMAQLAFEGLVKKETTFYCLPRDCKHLGFLDASCELHVKKGTSIAYSFLHLGLQEYLAAFHVSQLSPSVQTEIFQQYSGLDHLQNMWKFLAGLTGFRSIVWDLAKAQICSTGTLNPFVLQCMYEAHGQVTCEHVAGTSNVVFSQVQCGDQFQPIDCYALGCCLARSACSLSLRFCLDAEMLRMLALGLKSSGVPMIASTIETLFLRLPVTCATVDRLAELPPDVVQGLDLSHTNADQSVMMSLAKSIPVSMPGLKRLEIRGNPIGQGGLVLPLHALLSCNHLQSLSMMNTKIGCRDIAALANLTMPGGSLKELRIGDEGMPDECVKMLVSTVFASSSLEALHVWLVDLRSCMDSLSTLLESNRNLRKLEFHGCWIGSHGSQKMAKALEKNASLKALVISVFDVPTPYHVGIEGATALSEMLRVNQFLERLELLFDKSLGRTGALALMNALQHNHGLKCFKLPQHYFSSVEVLAVDSRVKWSSA